jgi:hypothetical protein
VPCANVAVETVAAIALSTPIKSLCDMDCSLPRLPVPRHNRVTRVAKIYLPKLNDHRVAELDTPPS